jgi:hypothetical protein
LSNFRKLRVIEWSCFGATQSPFAFADSEDNLGSTWSTLWSARAAAANADPQTPLDQSHRVSAKPPDSCTIEARFPVKRGVCSAENAHGSFLTALTEEDEIHTAFST